jgi:hypothetical protein
VEFRLLRPTYNLEKITYWIYLFNAILNYAEQMDKNQDLGSLTLESIFKEIYDEETCEMLSVETEKLKMLISIQSGQFGDNIGSTIHIEDNMFDKDLCL